MQRMMVLRASWILAAICAVAGAILASSVAIPLLAQDANLLRDPGFEGQYTGRGRADLNIPTDWGLWFTEAPRTESWMNLPPVAFPHRGPDPAPHTGVLAMNFNKGFSTYTAAIYQQATVPQGANLTGSAWGNQHTCNIGANTDRCGSAVESGAYMRVGIDPNGGTNPYDSDVVWSANATPHDVWAQISVTATATGGTATLFLFTTQQWPSQLNNAYWDDAVFSIGGSGGVAPSAGTPLAPVATLAPTAPPFVNFVTAQNSQPDGSIIHTVQSGDTVDSIAFAYGVTREQIVTLNTLRDARLIQIGQRLIIQAAVEATAEVTAETTAEITEAVLPGTPGTPDPALTLTNPARSTSRPMPLGTNTPFGGSGPAGGADARDPADAVSIALAPTSSADADEPDPAASTESVFSSGANASGAAVNDEAQVAEAENLVSNTSDDVTNEGTEGDAPISVPSTVDDENSAPNQGMNNADGSFNFGPTNPTPTATPFRGSANANPAPVISVASGEVLPVMNPAAQTASVCVLLFEDKNSNRIQEAGEAALSSGTARLLKADADVETATTDSTGDPHCFDRLEAGEYTVAMLPPEGYGLTSPEGLRVRAASGTQVNVTFGAAQGVAVAVLPIPDGANDAPSETGVNAAQSRSNPVTENMGLIVFGVAAAVLIAGSGATLLLRRH